MPHKDSFIKRWWFNLLYDPRDRRVNFGLDTNIVVVGGGTGLSNLLRGLKGYSNKITAIITCTDEGASSGQIRKKLDILPPGDIRKCISAMAEDEEMMAKIFEHRFKKNSKIFAGHTLGNIWLAALSEQLGSFEQAVENTSVMFKTAGRILPVSLDKVRLGAIYRDKTKSVGETNIPKPDKEIEKVFLDKPAKAYPKATEALQNADLIVIGPGSLYTSILPNFLVKNIVPTIQKNKNALVVYVANCSTERGETQNLSVEDHIIILTNYLGKDVLDFCLCNKKIIKKSKDISRIGSVNNITSQKKSVGSCKIIKEDVVNSREPLYHDSKKLAKAVISLYNKFKNKKKNVRV